MKSYLHMHVCRAIDKCVLGGAEATQIFIAAMYMYMYMYMYIAKTSYLYWLLKSASILKHPQTKKVVCGPGMYIYMYIVCTYCR